MIGYKKILSLYNSQGGAFLSDTNKDSDPPVERIHNMMQADYPGNYYVKEYYNINTMRFEVKLVFDDPVEETMFVLKWG